MINGGIGTYPETRVKEYLLIGTWEEFEQLHKALSKFISQRNEEVMFVKVNDKEQFKFRATTDSGSAL